MISIGTPLLWVGFIALILGLLVVDLGVFQRRDHAIHAGEALLWSAFWIGLALIFNAGIWLYFGAEKGGEFLTAFLVEKSLSVDNLFVFVLLFTAFGIPGKFQHRVLFWGIVTALVLRGIMILGGLALLARFHWLIYVFGAFLIYAGVKFVWKKDEEEKPEASWGVRFIRRVLPTTPNFYGHHFVTHAEGRWLATPLLLTLVSVEFSDVVFALDSIPAVFGVTQDPFIVFTSNIFAILGLRSLYFVLADMIDRFAYLKHGLAAVLVFVGTKMVIAPWVQISSLVSLAVILSLLTVTILFSLLKTRPKT
jgi:tellurite resistance protein TerC